LPVAVRIAARQRRTKAEIGTLYATATMNNQYEITGMVKLIVRPDAQERRVNASRRLMRGTRRHIRVDERTAAWRNAAHRLA